DRCGLCGGCSPGHRVLDPVDPWLGWSRICPCGHPRPGFAGTCDRPGRGWLGSSSRSGILVAATLPLCHVLLCLDGASRNFNSTSKGNHIQAKSVESNDHSKEVGG